jgi:hypothetical protein
METFMAIRRASIAISGITMHEDKTKITETEVVEPSQESLVQRLSGGKNRKYVRFLIAALGSIPWIGGFIAASASLTAEREQQDVNDLQKVWVQEHKEKIAELRDALNDIFNRLDNFGDQIQQRIESQEYLALVRKTFRAWDEADTQEKKQMLKRLIMNAGAIQLCDDDLIRLFLHWVELYHETHFVVVREIYKSHRITRMGRRPATDRQRWQQKSERSKGACRVAFAFEYQNY